MRNRDGRYNLMFEEWVTDGPFIISPRITFEARRRRPAARAFQERNGRRGGRGAQVSVRILGGLMALGYQIGTIMKRTSAVFSDDCITVKARPAARPRGAARRSALERAASGGGGGGAQVDDVEGMEGRFVQIQGKARGAVEAAGRALGLEGTYIPKSYIEQVQLAKLTASFQSISEDLRRRFVVDGEPLLESDSIGSSPVLASSLRRTTGFAVPPLASSGARPRRFFAGAARSAPVCWNERGRAAQRRPRPSRARPARPAAAAAC